MKAKNYYRSCMKSDEGNPTVLHDLISKVGGWNFTGMPTDMSMFNMVQKVLGVQKYTASTLFKW